MIIYIFKIKTWHILFNFYFLLLFLSSISLFYEKLNRRREKRREKNNIYVDKIIINEIFNIKIIINSLKGVLKLTQLPLKL